MSEFRVPLRVPCELRERSLGMVPVTILILSSGAPQTGQNLRLPMSVIV